MRKIFLLILSVCLIAVSSVARAEIVSVSAYLINWYEQILTGDVCDHIYADRVSEKEKKYLAGYLKAIRGEQFRHPSMVYAKSADITKFKAAGVPVEDIAGGKCTLTKRSVDLPFMKKITGECVAYMPDAYSESFMFTDAKNGASGTEYGYYCNNMQKEERRKRTYDENCENRKKIAYINCLKSIDTVDGLAKVAAMQTCQELDQTFEDRFCSHRDETYFVEDCAGDGFIVGMNGYNQPTIIVPFANKDGFASVSPNLREIPYKRIVEAMYEKYGAATLSVRRKNTRKDECSGTAGIHEYINTVVLERECQSGNFAHYSQDDCRHLKTFYSDTYYWLAKPWVLRIQVIFPEGTDKITDNTEVSYLSTIFMNWDNYTAQDEYVKNKKIKEKERAKNIKERQIQAEKRRKQEKIDAFKL